MLRSEKVSSIKSVPVERRNESQWGTKQPSLYLFDFHIPVMLSGFSAVTAITSVILMSPSSSFSQVSFTLLVLFTSHYGLSSFFPLMLSALTLVLRWGNYVRNIISVHRCTEEEINERSQLTWGDSLRQNRVLYILFFGHNASFLFFIFGFLRKGFSV